MVKNAGRPSSYKEEYAKQAYKLCLLGATDDQMADFFGCAKSTFSLWKTKHDDLSEALKKGKSFADARVAEALFHRALGYQHAEDKIFMHEGKPVVVNTTKHYPPDPVSCIYWLKNRRPDLWRDKPEASDDETDVAPVKIEVQVTDARKPVDG
ncbi:MAG: terminase [Rickettsiales bacterium]|mgnify:CR=1 FL=1|nr:terminase [Rickettsiales bacterium]|tara:strand:+ start:1854 stop:2312 length:459 start_codon:yes stop_codon:yes gene_type:complete